jgi:hypothetical protein
MLCAMAEIEGISPFKFGARFAMIGINQQS